MYPHENIGSIAREIASQWEGKQIDNTVWTVPDDLISKRDELAAELAEILQDIHTNSIITAEKYGPNQIMVRKRPR